MNKVVPFRRRISGRLLPDKDMTDLFRGIEMALPEQDSRVIYLISCYPGEGAMTISRELALFAVQEMGSRALLITVRLPESADGQADAEPQRSLLDVALGRGKLGDAIRNSADGVLWHASLMSGNEGEGLLSNLEKLKQVLVPLRNQFKLILISAPAILADPVAIGLGGLSDAAILVVEAERTRAPAARQALQALGKTGARVIGLAFNKRRYHIPERLYRLL